jgi:hypothetical protein
VLVDGDGVRAPMTASWLKQMGFAEVYVLDRADGIAEAGPEHARIFGLEATVATIGVRELAQLAQRGSAVVIDLDTSLVFASSTSPAPGSPSAPGSRRRWRRCRRKARWC